MFDVREEVLTMIITLIMGHPVSPSQELLRQLGIDPDAPGQVDMNDVYVRLNEFLQH